MLTVTKAVADFLGLASEDFEEAVTNTLFAYGIDDIIDADDISKLRTLARIEAWRMMVEATAGLHDHSTDTGGGSGSSSQYYKENQMHESAKSALAMAERDAVRLGYAIQGGVASMTAMVQAVW